MCLPTEGAPRSVLARIDPRSKLIGIGLLVISTSLIQSIPALLALLTVVVVAFPLCRLPMRRLAPVFLGVPLFTMAIILPAALNLVTPGQLLLVIWASDGPARLGSWQVPSQIGVSLPGLMIVVRFLLRTSACVAMVVLLTAATGPTELLGALRRLGMPRMFGVALTMMHRYLALLLKITVELHEARLSRPGGANGLTEGYQWAAAGIGIVFRRIWRIGQDVYQAMLSRGYDGEIRMIAQPRLVAKDWLWIGLCVIAVLASQWMNILW